MIVLPNELMSFRIGVVAGKTVGNAVQRNRAKRLIRNALQPLLASIPVGWDILFIARKSLPELSFNQVQEALNSLLRRSELLSETNELKV